MVIYVSKHCVIWLKMLTIVNHLLPWTFSILIRLRSGDEWPALTDPLRDGERGGRFLVLCLLHGPNGEWTRSCFRWSEGCTRTQQLPDVRALMRGFLILWFTSGEVIVNFYWWCERWYILVAINALCPLTSVKIKISPSRVRFVAVVRFPNQRRHLTPVSSTFIK